jgi:hypothetical protein
MRKTLLVALLIIFYTAAFTQDLREGYHITRFYVGNVPQVDINGTATTATTQPLVANRKFQIVNIVNGDYIIHLAEFGDSFSNASALNTQFVRSGNVDIYFRITKAQYDSSAIRIEKAGKWVIGTGTTLGKLRPGSSEPKDGYNIYSDFGNDFNIGATLGWKVTKKENSLTGLFGVGFGAIGVNDYTTKGFVDSSSNPFSITPSIGILVEIKKFQIGIFSGIDYLTGEVSNHWIYKGRPWLGLGFGYRIFRTEGDDKQD